MSTYEQKVAALRKGTLHGRERARLKRELKSRTRPLDETVFEEPALQTMALYDFVMALPGVWHSGAARIFRRTGLPERKPLGTLTERQRRLLLNVVSG